MSRHVAKAMFAAVLLLASGIAGANEATCTGRWLNPMTDICWYCVFPISIGAANVSGVSGVADTPNNPSPICWCPVPPPVWVRKGVTVGFWEPFRVSEVIRQPYCFPTLGGLDLSDSFGSVVIRGGHQRSQGTNDGTKNAQYHLHWQQYPAFYMMGQMTDSLCIESGGLDVAYLTELDPLWLDDESSAVLSPEAALFANPIMQVSCAADCLAATVGLPLDPMIWCAGCQGSLYPFTGNSGHHTNAISTAQLMTERFIAKLHREGLGYDSSNPAWPGYCAVWPIQVIKKSQYRLQLGYPIPSTIYPTCCTPFGRTSIPYEWAKEHPYVGEDFGYVIWRKRNCCAS